MYRALNILENILIHMVQPVLLPTNLSYLITWYNTDIEKAMLSHQEHMVRFICKLPIDCKWKETENEWN